MNKVNSSEKQVILGFDNKNCEIGYDGKTNLLICSPVGGGKTEALKLINKQLLKNDENTMFVIASDYKNEYKELSINAKVHYFPDGSIIELLDNLTKEIVVRKNILKENNANSFDDFNKCVTQNEKFKKYFLTIDDLDNFADEYRLIVIKKIFKLAKLGKGVGIYLLLSSQNINNEVIHQINFDMDLKLIGGYYIHDLKKLDLVKEETDQVTKLHRCPGRFMYLSDQTKVPIQIII